MILKLSKSDRKMISDVARIFKDMTGNADEYDMRYYDFWRISMYSKVAFLKRQDVHTIHTAMKAFSDVLKKYPYRDPTGEFGELDSVLKRLEDFMLTKGMDIIHDDKVDLEEDEKELLQE